MCSSNKRTHAAGCRCLIACNPTQPLLVRRLPRAVRAKRRHGAEANPVCECPRAPNSAAARAHALCCMPGALAWPHAGRRRRLESPCKVRFCRVTLCTERICTAPIAHRAVSALGQIPKIRWRKNGCAIQHGMSTRKHTCCFGSGTMDRQGMPAEARQGSNEGPFKRCTEAMCPV